MDVAHVVTIALSRAVLCLDCERIFELGLDGCPTCGGRAWYPLERFITGGGGDRKLVRVEDVVHEAGNGLTPARVRAEQLVVALDEYVATGVARHPVYLRLCLAHAPAHRHRDRRDHAPPARARRRARRQVRKGEIR